MHLYITSSGLDQPVWHCATGSRLNTEVKQRQTRLVLRRSTVS